MGGLIYFIIIIFVLKALAKKYGSGSGRSKTSAVSGKAAKAPVSFQMPPDTSGKRASAVKKTASAKPNEKRASAVPNMPKKQKKTKEEAQVAARTRESARACQYEAAYSRGKPERIGLRADYEPTAPSGKSRVRCAYCGAENFVPSGSREHYHCYFCWEKL